jgi:hypothetical protein
MSVFAKRYAKEVEQFGDWAYVVSREHNTREEALELFREWLDDVELEEVEASFIRFSIPPAEVHEDDPYMKGEPCWWGPVGEGKGAKPVWIVEMP